MSIEIHPVRDLSHYFGSDPTRGRRTPVGPASYDANEDGPWVREPEEFNEQMRLLLAELSQIGGAPPDDSSVPTTARAAYAAGVWAASNWTLSRKAEAPITRVPLVVNDAGLREEIAVAWAVVDADEHEMGVAYSRGVLAWFGWLAGARPTIPYLD